MRSFLKFGLFTGMINCLWLLTAFEIVKAINPGVPTAKARAITGMLSVLVLILGIYFGIRAAKRQNNSKLNYKSAVFTGIKIALVNALICGLFSVLYCNVINPGYANAMVAETEQLLKAAGTTPEQMQLKLEATKKMYSTPSQVMQALVAQSIMGTLVSLIISLFLKTKKS